jgi:hypothetical protein
MNFQEDVRFPMSRCDDELVADWLLFNIVGILRYLYVSIRIFAAFNRSTSLSANTRTQVVLAYSS